MRRAFAILLNLILWPGSGHYALGRFARGHAWAGITLLLIVLAPLSLYLPLVSILLRPLSAIDSGLVKVQSIPRAGRWGLILGGVGAVLAAFALVRGYYLEGFKIASGSMIPTLEIGDHVFVNKLAYQTSDPGRGDLIVYVNPCQPDKEFMHRVVALGGDTVEVRCDVLYVNGAAAPTVRSRAECHYWDRDAVGRWDKTSCSRYTETLDGVQHDIMCDSSRPEADGDRSSPRAADYMYVRGDHDFPDEQPQSCQEMGAFSDEPFTDERPPGRIEESTPERGKVKRACAPLRRYRVPEGHVFVLGDNRDNASDSRAWGPVPVDNVVGRAFGIWWPGGAPDQGIRWGRIGHVY